MTTQEQVKDVVSQVLADKADKGGIKRVVWIGAGGSNGGNYPAQYFMELTTCVASCSIKYWAG